MIRKLSIVLATILTFAASGLVPAASEPESLPAPPQAEPAPETQLPNDRLWELAVQVTDTHLVSPLSLDAELNLIAPRSNPKRKKISPMVLPYLTLSQGLSQQSTGDIELGQEGLKFFPESIDSSAECLLTGIRHGALLLKSANLQKLRASEKFTKISFTFYAISESFSEANMDGVVYTWKEGKETYRKKLAHRITLTKGTLDYPIIYTAETKDCFFRKTARRKGEKALPEGIADLAPVIQGHLKAAAADKTYRPRVELIASSLKFNQSMAEKNFNFRSSVGLVNGIFQIAGKIQQVTEAGEEIPKEDLEAIEAEIAQLKKELAEKGRPNP